MSQELYLSILNSEWIKSQESNDNVPKVKWTMPEPYIGERMFKKEVDKDWKERMQRYAQKHGHKPSNDTEKEQERFEEQMRILLLWQKIKSKKKIKNGTEVPP